MADPAKRKATYEDLLAVDERMLAQIVNGELIASPRPATGHALASTGLGALIGGPFGLGRGGPGGWWILFEPELHFGADVLVPDLAGWQRSRMPVVPQAPFLTLAPDWICEVLSPSTAGLDRVRKLPIYAREGVGHAWLVDPQARTLEVLRRQEATWVVAAAFSGDDRARAEPFEAVELELSALWADPAPG